MRLKLLICITLTAISLSGAVKADNKMDFTERVSHCKSLANLAYLVAKKVKTGRELKEIKKELSSVSKAALNSTNGAKYSEVFLIDYVQLLQDTYSTKPKWAKEYALDYRNACLRTEGQSN